MRTRIRCAARPSGRRRCRDDQGGADEDVRHRVEPPQPVQGRDDRNDCRASTARKVSGPASCSLACRSALVRHGSRRRVGSRGPGPARTVRRPGTLPQISRTGWAIRRSSAAVTKLPELACPCIAARIRAIMRSACGGTRCAATRTWALPPTVGLTNLRSASTRYRSMTRCCASRKSATAVAAAARDRMLRLLAVLVVLMPLTLKAPAGGPRRAGYPFRPAGRWVDLLS